MTVRSALKDAIFWSYVNVVRPVPSRIRGLQNFQRIVVLLYHRVNDDLRDRVTTGIAQFDEQMAWLRQHYDIVDIEDVIRGNVPRASKHPVIVVTFEDGYEDNYANAVPILRRHRIPASFFISTGIVGTDNGFAHDLNKLGYALPNMSWDQLREMKEMGFTIGSHTVTHLNCAQADLDTVRRELIESRDTLYEQLGLEEQIFAYPFGGRSDIKPEAMALIKEAGYIGCLSAYGGCIESDVDLYDIPRTAVSCGFAMNAFRARLEGFCR